MERNRHLRRRCDGDGRLYVLMYLNYAPLWSRVYNTCVDSQPEAASITEALRRRSECMRWASSAVEQEMKLDETSRGSKGR